MHDVMLAVLSSTAEQHWPSSCSLLLGDAPGSFYTQLPEGQERHILHPQAQVILFTQLSKGRNRKAGNRNLQDMHKIF